MSWECTTRKACRESHGHDKGPPESYFGHLELGLGVALAGLVLFGQWVISLF